MDSSGSCPGTEAKDGGLYFTGGTPWSRPQGPEQRGLVTALPTSYFPCLELLWQESQLPSELIP